MYIQVTTYDIRDMEGYGDENGPKRTRLASVWALGEFFYFFFVFFRVFFITKTNIYCINRLLATWRMWTTKTGPNGCKTHPFGH